jgi:hypothetical protein
MLDVTDNGGRPTTDPATQDANLHAHQYDVMAKPGALAVYIYSIYRITTMQAAGMLSTLAEEVPTPFSCAFPDRQVVEGAARTVAFAFRIDLRVDPYWVGTESPCTPPKRLTVCGVGKGA